MNILYNIYMRKKKRSDLSINKILEMSGQTVIMSMFLIILIKM